MITKTDAAERQLNTSIRLFFESRDHLSSYALAIASREVSDGVIQSRRSEIYERELARLGDPMKVRLSYWEEMKVLIEDKFHKDFVTLDHKWQNFLKHAKTDPDAEIEPFKTKLLALVIMFAIKNYVLLTQHWTPEMATFFAWFVVAEPQLLELAPDDLATDTIIAELRSSLLVDPYDRDTLEAIYTAMTHA